MIREHFDWILGSLCQLQRVPFDPALLLQQFPPPYDYDGKLAVRVVPGYDALAHLRHQLGRVLKGLSDAAAQKKAD